MKLLTATPIISEKKVKEETSQLISKSWTWSDWVWGAEVEKIQRVQTEQVQAQVTTQVVTDLETNIVDVIKQTVSADGVDLDDTRSLVQLIIERLWPVIFEAIKKALQSSAFEIDANDLTIRIIIGKKHMP